MPQNFATSQEIAARLDKLCFITNELVIAANLASSATHSDMARMLARHVAVRTADFIAHARRLRNCLPSSSASTKFKETVNAFNAEFEENLELSRHKLGAHVQDMDFLQRIDIWVSIDTSMIDYFVGGAREIWDLLGSMSVPGHRLFVSPTVLADPSVASILQHLAEPVAIQATFGTDPLSFARANTSSMLNGTPIHLRAGQLALLRRWMSDQRELLVWFKAHPEVARIIKARLITDIVSFRDCLITRPVAPGAPQELAGLDALIVGEGKTPKAIQAFVSTSRDGVTLEPMRRLRNRVGGHLEIEPAVTLQTMLTELDQFDLDVALRHYAGLEAVFVETCRSIDFLTTHLIDGMNVGANLLQHMATSPFDAARPDIIAGPPPKLTFSQVEMHEQLARWVRGHSDLRRAALEYFREAFARAPTAETRSRVEDLGSGKRFHQLEIKTSHLFLRDALIAADPTDEQQILLLASQCPGYRDALTDVLAEYCRASGCSASPALLTALGTLAAWWLEDARAIVEEAIQSEQDTKALLARLILLRIFVREEGVKRMNGRPGHTTWSAISAKILTGVPPSWELAAHVAFASAFMARDTAIFIRKFTAEYGALANAALTAAKQRLGGTLNTEREADLRKLLHQGDVGQAVLLIITTGPQGHARPTKQALLQAFALGYIETGNSYEEGTAVAEILLHSGAPSLTLEVLAKLRCRAPGNIEPGLRTVEVLAGIEGLADDAKKLAGQIREQFSLDEAGEARLRQVEGQLKAV